MTMAKQEAIRSKYEAPQDDYSVAYDRLGLSRNASLSEVVKAINYYEGARQSFSSNTPFETMQTEALYKAMYAHGIREELDRCINSSQDLSSALQGLLASLEAAQQPPLSDESVQELDEQFFDLALYAMSDAEVSPREKAAAITLSLRFAAEQRGVAKTQMILERRLAAEQAAALTHINTQAREAAHQQLDAVKGFFQFAGLEYHTQAIDSKMSASAQKAADIARTQLERSRHAFEDGKQVGRKAASVTVLASMAVVGTANMAAAEGAVSVQNSSPAGSESAIVAQTISAEQQQGVLETPMTAVVAVEAVEAPVEAVQIGTPPVVSEALATTVVEDIDRATVQVSAIGVAAEPITEKEAAALAVVEVQEATENQEAAPLVTIQATDQVAQPAAETKPAAVVTTESQPEEAEAAPVQPSTLVAPNSDVNVAAGETPQEALARIVASRDMKAASYAIRQNFGGIDSVNQPAANETLKAFIDADVETLRAKIPEAAHQDPAYTEKAFFALAYLDAVSKNPSLLDNPEVAAFVASITDQGEAYRNKLFATYVAEAKTALSAENAGAYANVAEQYRAPIENLYGYVAMAAATDEVQAQQIQAIKDEEARIAAEEEAKRKAAEAAAQGLGEIEAIAADEKRLVLTAIDRAEQQGLITARYAAVYRIVIDSEGPGARAAAAGIVGNCMAEAAGCDPMIVERGNGIGFGIFQWSFGRRTTLENTAAAQGVDVGDLRFQVLYALAESKNRTTRDGSGNEWAGMMSQTDPGAAAEFWRWNFERPKDHLSSTNTRIQVAQEVFAHVNGQMDAIRNEAAAAKAERERIAAEAAAAAAAEAERQRAAAAEGDIRPQLANGLDIRVHLKGKYSNESGHLDGSELVERDAHNQYGEPIKVYIHPEAAPGFDAMTAAYQAQFGEPLRITDHYRDYNEQVSTKRAKGHLAATPGKSNHGWGMALDLASNINKEGSPQHEWMEQNAHKFGWVNPRWAHDGTPKGGAEEPWHWEFDGNQATFETTNN